MNNIIPITMCYVTNIGVFLTTMENQSPWWVSLIVSLVSPIFYFLVKYVFDIMITRAKKNGDITKEQAKDLQDKADDITDDGKLNNSNKEENK